jgi:hypothetical protein
MRKVRKVHRPHTARRPATPGRSVSTEEREVVGSEELSRHAAAPVRGGTQQSLHQIVQAKMAVSSPSDAYEVEAERVANNFVDRSYSADQSESSALYSTASHAPSEEISRRASGDGLNSKRAGLETTEETDSAISQAATGGRSLDAATKDRFEAGLGADLSSVKIHADGQSDSLCRSLSAEAFTTGSDVFFSSGAYQPGTKPGDRLLAHELTHVVQQHSAPVVARSIFGKSESEKKAQKMREDREAQKKAFMAQTMTQEELDEVTGEENRASQTGADEANDDTVVDAGTSQLKDSVTQGREMADVGATGKSTAQTKGEEQSGGIIGLATSTKALIMSVIGLYKAIKSEETDKADVAEAAAASVKEALGVVENSLKVATAFGGTVGSAAVPGIGIAISTMSAAQEILNIYRANRDIKAMEADRDSTTDEKKKLAVDNLIRRRKRSYFGAIANLVGDITMLIGNIGVVASGGAGAPWALIVVASGAMIKVISAIGQAIDRWVEAKYTNQARDNLAAAKDLMAKATTDEEKQAAKEQLNAAEELSLRDDATYAASFILEKAVGMRGDDGSYDPRALKIISSYGLDQKWLDKYAKSDKSPAVFQQGVDVILATAGTSRNPRGFIDSLVATGKTIAGYFVSFWNFITGKKILAGANPEMSPIRIKLRAEDEIFNALVPVLAKFDENKPPVAAKINDKFTKIYKALMAAFAPDGYQDKKKAAYNAEIIKAAAIEILLNSEGGKAIDPISIDIRDGKFEYKLRSKAKAKPDSTPKAKVA